MVNAVKTLIVSIVVTLIVCAILAIPIMYIWNAVIPSISNVSEITYLQSVGITLVGHLCTFKLSKD